MTASSEASGRALYRAEQVRELDRRTIAAGIAGFALMQRAAAAAFQVLREAWPEARSLSVLCGAGNNGGDGHVLAALAAAEGEAAERGQPDWNLDYARHCVKPSVGKGG